MTFTLLASGSNACGQLATGDLEDSHSFIPCNFLGSGTTFPLDTKRVLQIACGSNHTLILLERNLDGQPKTELWGCGDGRRGQLGPHLSQESTTIFTPVQLPLEADSLFDFHVRLIATAWDTSFVVLSHKNSSDVLVSMGADDFGDLGIGSAVKKGKARVLNIVDLYRVVHDQVKEGRLSVTSIAAGPHHVMVSVGVTAKDDSLERFILGWGTSRHGQLGSVTKTAFIPSPAIVKLPPECGPVSSIKLGNQHTVFLHAGGLCTGIGSDRKNQTHGISALRDVQGIGCTWNGTYALTDDEALLANGSNNKGQLGRSGAELGFAEVEFPAGTKKPRTFACGSEHVLAIVAKDEVWGWGWNEHGNLGTGTTEDIHRPVRIWSGEDGSLAGIWAGYGTSWILLNQGHTDVLET